MKLVSHGVHTYYTDGYTRAAVECGKMTLFINLQGDVETSKGDAYKIDTKEFLRFHDSLRPTEHLLRD